MHLMKWEVAFAGAPGKNRARDSLSEPCGYT